MLLKLWYPNVSNKIGYVKSQDNGEMLSLLGVIEHCLKAGKKQLWHPASMTNICVGLLAGLKVVSEFIL